MLGFATGDHLHLNVALGKYTGWHNVGGQFYEINNSQNIYNMMFVNDTVLYNDYGYNWRIYEGGVTPPTPKISREKFPWVLYARKFRNRYR